MERTEKTDRDVATELPDGAVSEGKPSGEDLSLKIAELLEEDIVFGRLHPLQRLIEEEISTQFGVKRHITRQALVELERLGLVERQRNRGALVRLYGEKEVEDINHVRELLESHAATLIPLPLAADAVAELEDIQARHSKAVETGDTRGVFRSNIAFHQALFAHCGNQALIDAIAAHAQMSHAYRSIFVNNKDYLRWAVGAHLAMIDALKSGDRDALVRLCREHLAPAKNRYLETLRARFG